MSDSATVRLLVQLEARMSKYEKDISRARQRSDREFGGIQARAVSASKAIASSFATLGTGLLAGGAVTTLRNVARNVAAVGDEAKRAGVSLQSFQEWKFVAEQNRIGIDSMIDGLKELNLRGDEFATTGKGSAAEAFQRLGYGAEELKAKLADPSALLLEIIGRLGQMDKAAQIRISDELFGGSAGERFVELIDQGEAGIRATIGQAHALGIVMDAEMVAKAAEIDRQFNIVASTVGTALKGAIVDAATALSDFIRAFNGFESERNAKLDERLAALGRERLDTEQKIAEIRSRGDGMAGDGLFGTSFGDSGALGAIADHERRMEAIQAEEAAILKVTEARREAAAATPASGGFTPAPYTPPPATGGGSSAGSIDRENELERAAAQIQRRIALMQLETAQLAQVNPALDAYGAATEAAAVKAQLLNAAQEAGVALTPEVSARIDELSRKYGEASGEAQKLADEQEEARAKAQEWADFAGGLVSGFVNDLRNGKSASEAFSNALGKITNKLIDMMIQMLIVGPIMKMFGFAGGGSVPGGGKLLKLAGGGHVSGPGTPTSDSIPAMLSDGEFVVNAAATRKHGALLAAINSGRVPALRDGGVIGGTGSSQAFGRGLSGGDQNISISAPVTVNASGGTPEQNQDLAAKMAKSLEQSMRGVVADEIRRAQRPGNLLRRMG